MFKFYDLVHTRKQNAYPVDVLNCLFGALRVPQKSKEEQHVSLDYFAKKGY